MGIVHSFRLPFSCSSPLGSPTSVLNKLTFCSFSTTSQGRAGVSRAHGENVLEGPGASLGGAAGWKGWYAAEIVTCDLDDDIAQTFYWRLGFLDLLQEQLPLGSSQAAG
jgi:hypothetical protein